MLGVFTIVSPAAERGWTSGRTLGFAVASGVLLVAFIVREAKASNPLMPLRIFRSRDVCGANVIQVLGAAGMFGTFFLGALYVQKVLHYSPLEIGFAFLPVSVLMGAVSVGYSERLIGRFGSRALCATGLTLIAGALAMFATVPVDGGYWRHIFPPLVVIGLGAGLCFPPLMGLAMSGATPQDAGLASGLINATGQVGGALGLAVLATLTSTRTDQLTDSGHDLRSALTGAYHLGSGSPPDWWRWARWSHCWCSARRAAPTPRHRPPSKRRRSGGRRRRGEPRVIDDRGTVVAIRQVRPHDYRDARRSD